MEYSFSYFICSPGAVRGCGNNPRDNKGAQLAAEKRGRAVKTLRLFVQTLRFFFAQKAARFWLPLAPALALHQAFRLCFTSSASQALMRD